MPKESIHLHQKCNFPLKLLMIPIFCCQRGNQKMFAKWQKERILLFGQLPKVHLCYKWAFLLQMCIFVPKYQYKIVQNYQKCNFVTNGHFCYKCAFLFQNISIKLSRCRVFVCINDQKNLFCAKVALFVPKCMRTFLL